MKLLQKSETCDDVSEVVQAYDVFLERYPLCFGYWKKYSDILKKRNRSNEDILKVRSFESRFCSYIKLTFFKTFFLLKHGCVTWDLFQVFERGVKAIPQSVDLWIHFSNFLLSNVYSQKTEEHVRSLRELVAFLIVFHFCFHNYDTTKSVLFNSED